MKSKIIIITGATASSCRFLFTGKLHRRYGTRGLAAATIRLGNIATKFYCGPRSGSGCSAEHRLGTYH